MLPKQIVVADPIPASECFSCGTGKMPVVGGLEAHPTIFMLMH